MFADTFNPALQWLNAHPYLACFGVFLISTAESVAIIGTIIPGTVMMTAIGTLAGAGVIPLWPTIICAILGAIFGDGISYWLGHHYKYKLHNIWPFRRYPHILVSGENFFNKYGGMGVLIGRFVGPVRALVPLVAGMMGMTPLRFYIANIASAIGWAPAYMLPGIVLGAASLELPPDIAVHVILMLLFSAFFICLCVWLVRKIFLLVSRHVNTTLNRIWNFFQYSRRFRVVASTLKHYDESQTHGQLTLAFYFLLTSMIFIYFALHLGLSFNHHIAVNNAFYFIARSLRSPHFDHLMIFLTLCGDKIILIPVTIAAFLFLVFRKSMHTAWHTLGLLITSVLSIELIKLLVRSERPWGILHLPMSFSFPSGHATLSAALFIPFIILLAHTFNLQRRTLLYALMGLFIFAIGVSRLYLGAHWFTDVLGGWLLASSLIMLVTISYNRKKETSAPSIDFFVFCILAFFLTVSINYHYRLKHLSQDYQVLPWPTHYIELNNWWNGEGKYFPVFRIGRVGLPSEILNLQWLGNLQEIKSALMANGWETPSGIRWLTLLHRISDVESTEHLPVVSPLYFDKDPVLVLVKPFTDKRLVVLRLWDSNLIVKDSVQPLWVGTVGLVPRTYSWLFTYKDAIAPMNTDTLFVNPINHYDIKQMKITPPQKHKLKFQHEIILIKLKN